MVVPVLPPVHYRGPRDNQLRKKPCGLSVTASVGGLSLTEGPAGHRHGPVLPGYPGPETVRTGSLYPLLPCPRRSDRFSRPPPPPPHTPTRYPLRVSLRTLSVNLSLAILPVQVMDSISSLKVCLFVLRLLSLTALSISYQWQTVSL